MHPTPHPIARWRHPRLTVLVAVVAWFGLGLQLMLSLRLVQAQGGTLSGGLALYLSYFTVLTNLLVAVSLSWPLLRPHSTPGRWFQQPGVATAVAVNIALVGMSYHLLLRNVWDPQGLQKVADITLHYAVPLLCVVHWWFSVPPARMAWRAPLVWTAWPLAYLAYALLRGLWVQSYPYPFIDVTALGYSRTLLNSLVLLMAFLLVGAAFVAVARWRLQRPAR
ncbi:Pr6Pr family membrane protein [Hydrogenophaga sp.]|uniref:Pr6Pr family membrane protein n=1 Tax=Hydrogenophaga sp. TaxID=1904254 RepID=UPI0027194E16|nr:Pr6Pr family membrane protein [Hydrogenophaga sp.]MDO9435494.1 Pr6Pr family membrane protein [Hydrogenophaga sp.]